MSDPHSSHSNPPAGGHGSDHGHDHALAHEADHIRSHTRLYLGIGAALFACTVLTVAISYVHFGSESMNILIGLLLATFKAGLVAAVFMHLIGEKKDIFRFMIPTMVFLFALIGLCVLAFYDPIHF